MKRAAWVLGVITAVLAGAAGWIASSSPDGLEHVAEKLGFASRGTAVVSGSPLAGYPVGSGLVGVALLFGFGVLFARLLKRRN
jgi:hypothetical protein